MKMKIQRKCRVCGKNITEKNKSGLCGHHFRVEYRRKLRKKYKEKHICLNCQKPVEKIIIIDGNKRTERYPTRCSKCREKNRQNIRRQKNEKQDKTQMQEVC